MNENTQIFPTDYTIIRAWMDLNYFWKGRRISKKRKKKNWTKWKNRRKIFSVVIKVLSFDRAASRDSKKLHDNKQHRLSFEQASSSILFFDFSATLPALVFFLPSSGSHHSAWPSGIYPEPPTRRISSSDMFWFHFLFFFYFYGFIPDSFWSRMHLEFKAACQRCEQPEHAEKHTHGEKTGQRTPFLAKIKRVKKG